MIVVLDMTETIVQDVLNQVRLVKCSQPLRSMETIE